LVFHPGPALALFGLVRISLGAIVAIGLFYLIIKLAGLVGAMTEAKRATSKSTASHSQTGSASA